MKPPLGDLDSVTFLRDYWQKKPLLIRQALADFEPELDADDIAGLACDELAESRLISGSFPAHDWNLQYGPFNEKQLSRLPQSGWTLLVQDVEKHYPPLRRLLDAFAFLPRWRLDDLMVSVAAPGGSVGPHVDQYDVFLLQAEGRRRWQIARQFDPSLRPNCELNVLDTFEPEQEWVLEPGDMLYLPPGVAHHGVALDTGMTWSIGMRAPSSADLLQSLGEWLADTMGEGERYSDPDLAGATAAGEIDNAARLRLRELAVRQLHDEGSFNRFIGAFLSRYRLAHEPAPPEQSTSPDMLIAALNNGAILRHNPWTRLLWSSSNEQSAVFAAGKHYACDEETARILCDMALLEQHGAALAKYQAELLCRMVNEGHLYLEDSE